MDFGFTGAIVMGVCGAFAAWMSFIAGRATPQAELERFRRVACLYGYGEWAHDTTDGEARFELIDPRLDPRMSKPAKK